MSRAAEQVEGEGSRDIATIDALERYTATHINDAFGELLVDDTSRVLAEPFCREHGGPVESEIVGRDEAMVTANEEAWAGIYDADPLVARSLGIDPTGLTAEQMTTAMRERLPELREQRRLSDGSLAETIAVASLNRAFPEMITVKTHASDDERGVDLMMVDRLTGQPFGFLDIVTDEERGERVASKMEKVRIRNERGGSTIRYGVAMDAGRPVRASLDHVPTFAFQLPREKLDEWLLEMSRSDGAPDELAELVVGSIEQQATEFALDRKIPPVVRNKIAELLTATLPWMRSMVPAPEIAAA